MILQLGALGCLSSEGELSLPPLRLQLALSLFLTPTRSLSLPFLPHPQLLLPPRRFKGELEHLLVHRLKSKSCPGPSPFAVAVRVEGRQIKHLSLRTLVRSRIDIDT